jgi:hypothetical protein
MTIVLCDSEGQPVAEVIWRNLTDLLYSTLVVEGVSIYPTVFELKEKTDTRAVYRAAPGVTHFHMSELRWYPPAQIRA